MIYNMYNFFSDLLCMETRVISAVVISRHFDSLITFIMYFKQSTCHLYIFKGPTKCNVIFACQIISKLSNNTNFLIINTIFLSQYN